MHNFSAGPGILPSNVLEKVQSELLNYKNTGCSVMEMSHRSKEFQEIIQDAKKDLRELLNIPENYKILFMQGLIDYVLLMDRRSNRTVFSRINI